MADKVVRIENLPTPSTHQAVALEMWKQLRYKFDKHADSIEAELALYRRCLAATYNKPDTGG